MNTAELKIRLKSKIDEVDQNDLLEQLLALIELETKKEEVFTIPEEHKPGIEEGLEQIADGQVKTHKQVMAKYNK